MPDGDEQSLALTPRDYSDITKLQEPTILEQFLEHPLTASLETITGAFAGGGKGLLISAGRIAQGLVKGQMYQQVAHELRSLREAGKIPDNLGETRNGLHTWAELMAIIDTECPDADRLEALKAMFYAVNKVGRADADRIFEYQLWQIAKQLRSGDLILLRTLYQHRNPLDTLAAPQWSENVGERSGLQAPELVTLHVRHLREYNLVVASTEPRYVISTLGSRFCQTIETYKIDLEAAPLNT